MLARLAWARVCNIGFATGTAPGARSNPLPAPSRTIAGKSKAGHHQSRCHGAGKCRREARPQCPARQSHRLAQPKILSRSAAAVLCAIQPRPGIPLFRVADRSGVVQSIEPLVRSIRRRPTADRNGPSLTSVPDKSGLALRCTAGGAHRRCSLAFGR
jgi:hypothetical protein